MLPTITPDAAHMVPIWVPCQPHMEAHRCPTWVSCGANMGPIWVPSGLAHLGPRWGHATTPKWGPLGLPTSDPYGSHLGVLAGADLSGLDVGYMWAYILCGRRSAVETADLGRSAGQRPRRRSAEAAGADRPAGAGFRTRRNRRPDIVTCL